MKILKSVLLPDIHFPYHDKKTWNAVIKFIKWFKPDQVVLMGDALEMSAINHWKREKGNLRFFEGKRLIKEYKKFIREILVPIEKLCPKAKKVYLGGNHEEWANRLIDEQPNLAELIEPEVVMNLATRGWKWIPYVGVDKNDNVVRGSYTIGKLTLVHGEYTNKYHAGKTSDVFSKSVAYGHTHDIQLYTKVHVEDPSDYHTAQSIGCLCNRSPEFGKGRANRWVHSFGVLYTRPNGHYNLYVPIIIGGRFTFAGKNF